MRNESATWRWQKPLSAMLMGAAVPVMHYTGMAAVTFMPMATAVSPLHSVEISSLGIVVICTFTVIILGIAILTSLVDRKFSAQARELDRLMEEAVVSREALAKTEERLRLTVHSCGVAVWSWEVGPNILEGDQNAAGQFGVPMDRFPKTIEEFAALLHPDDRARVEREVAEALECGADHNSEFRVLRPDGTIRFLTIRGKVYLDEMGARSASRASAWTSPNAARRRRISAPLLSGWWRRPSFESC